MAAVAAAAAAPQTLKLRLGPREGGRGVQDGLKLVDLFIFSKFILFLVVWSERNHDCFGLIGCISISVVKSGVATLYNVPGISFNCRKDVLSRTMHPFSDLGRKFESRGVGEARNVGSWKGKG